MPLSREVVKSYSPLVKKITWQQVLFGFVKWGWDWQEAISRRLRTIMQRNTIKNGASNDITTRREQEWICVNTEGVNDFQQRRSWGGGGGRVMRPPWPVESKRRENGRQNEYFKNKKF
jgi:hypothetical protein